jgi:hypothetical protein
MIRRRRGLYTESDIIAIGRMRSAGVSRVEAERRLFLSNSIRKRIHSSARRR